MKSIVQDNIEICALCNKQIYGSRDKHHIFNGAMRNKSEEDGLFVYLHSSCHQWLHNHSMTMRTMKQRGQRAYELNHSREEFMERYKKNYLED